MSFSFDGDVVLVLVLAICGEVVLDLLFDWVIPIVIGCGDGVSPALFDTDDTDLTGFKLIGLLCSRFKLVFDFEELVSDIVVFGRVTLLLLEFVIICDCGLISFLSNLSSTPCPFNSASAVSTLCVEVKDNLVGSTDFHMFYLVFLELFEPKQRKIMYITFNAWIDSRIIIRM